MIKKDAPARRCAATTDLRALEEAVGNKDRSARLIVEMDTSQDHELRDSATPTELAVRASDTRECAQHCSTRSYANTRFSRKFDSIDKMCKRGSHDTPPRVRVTDHADCERVTSAPWMRELIF